MAYQPVNSLANLAQFSKVPLALTGDALASIDRGNEADQSNLQDLFSLNQHNQVMRPMQEDQQSLANQTMQAGLPGVMANSQIAQRRNKNEDIFNDAHIQDIMGKYKADEVDRHVKSMAALGTAAQQAAELVWNNPIGGSVIAKQMFERLGHGDKWNPAWDKLRPDQLAMTLSEAGKGIQSASEKFNQAISGLRTKQEFALELQARKDAAAQARQDSRLTTMHQMHRETLATKKELDKASVEQLAGRMDGLAREAAADGDQESATKYRAEAEKYYQAAQRLAALRGATNNEPKLDTAALINNGEFKTVNPARTSTDPVPLNKDVPGSSPTNPIVLK